MKSIEKLSKVIEKTCADSGGTRTNQKRMRNVVDEIIDFFKEKKGHTLADCTFIDVERYSPIIVWDANREIDFTLNTGNDKRYWRGFADQLKAKFPQIKMAYLYKSDGSCSAMWIVRLEELEEQ